MVLSSKTLLVALALLVLQAAAQEVTDSPATTADTTTTTTTTTDDSTTVFAAGEGTPTSEDDGSKNRRSLLSSADSVDSKMVKMEKLRSQMFNPGGTSSQSPVQQAAALKEGSRSRMQERLTELFEGTQKAQLARRRAKEAMDRAFVVANPEAK